jgi:hypothetical protein
MRKLSAGFVMIYLFFVGEALMVADEYQILFDPGKPDSGGNGKQSMMALWVGSSMVDSESQKRKR